MTTTSLKLPPEVKRLAAKAAAERGVSTHAFMVDAIEKAAETADWEASFARDAAAALARTVKTNRVYEFEDVRAYVSKLAAGKRAKPPKAVPWRR